MLNFISYPLGKCVYRRLSLIQRIPDLKLIKENIEDRSWSKYIENRLESEILKVIFDPLEYKVAIS